MSDEQQGLDETQESKQEGKQRGGENRPPEPGGAHPRREGEEEDGGADGPD
jgi:hypothetical protein